MREDIIRVKSQPRRGWGGNSPEQKKAQTATKAEGPERKAWQGHVGYVRRGEVRATDSLGPATWEAVCILF